MSMSDTLLSRTDDDGTDLEQGFAALDQSSGAAVSNPREERTDFFVRRDGMTFAGTHLIIDLYDAEQGLDDPKTIEAVLVDAARKAGATVLSTDFHHFQPNGGVSGVVVLAESHISIHTWPERGFAALDVFMCGECQPIKTVGAIKAAFKPGRIALNEIRRGVVAD
jgi:S-adenosylmethionine decarboxylase